MSYFPIFHHFPTFHIWFSPIRADFSIIFTIGWTVFKLYVIFHSKIRVFHMVKIFRIFTIFRFSICDFHPLGQKFPSFSRSDSPFSSYTRISTKNTRFSHGGNFPNFHHFPTFHIWFSPSRATISIIYTIRRTVLELWAFLSSWLTSLHVMSSRMTSLFLKSFEKFGRFHFHFEPTYNSLKQRTAKIHKFGTAQFFLQSKILAESEAGNGLTDSNSQPRREVSPKLWICFFFGINNGEISPLVHSTDSW